VIVPLDVTTTDGTNSPRMVRKVHGTNGTKSPRMVRKVHGTKRPWYEKSTNGTKRLWYEKSMVRKVWFPQSRVKSYNCHNNIVLL